MLKVKFSSCFLVLICKIVIMNDIIVAWVTFGVRPKQHIKMYYCLTYGL